MKRWPLIAMLLVACVVLCLERSKASSEPKTETVTQEPAIGSPEELVEAKKRVAEFGGLLLPDTMYAVAGQPFDIFFQDIVPVKDPEVFDYHVTGDTDGIIMRRRSLHIAFPAGAKGTHSFILHAGVHKGAEVTASTVKFVVVPKDAGKGKKITALLIGDSLGHQSQYPNAIYRMVQQPGNPKVTFVGTNHPAGSLIAEETYGGWQYKTFTTLYGVDPKAYHRDRSPFVFAPEKEGGTPVFDVKRYLDEDLKGVHPDFVHIQLGGNDTFLLKLEDPNIEQQLDQVMVDADTLIAGIRKALPNAVISVSTVVTGNADDRSYIESYAGNPWLYSEWRWRQLRLKLIKRSLEHFAHRENEGVFLVPAHATVDPIDGFSAHSFTPWHETYDLSQAVHTTPVGDEQIAEPIYAGMKAWLAGLNHGQ